MNKKEKLALFLGMLSGDGCLVINYNKEGYRDYPIDFVNTEQGKVILFSRLLYDLFGLNSNIYPRKRDNRKILWQLRKRSVKTYKKLSGIGFPEGIKRDKLRILNIIKNGSKKEKAAFIYGVLITDGSIGDRRILFHSGSKLFLEDLSKLISEFTNVKKPVREYVQREFYKSYQLCLNKAEKEIILSRCPRGTMVLR